MIRKFLLTLLIAGGLGLSMPFVSQAQTNFTCIERGSDQWLCDAMSPVSNNCRPIAGSGGGGERPYICSGIPQEYSCTKEDGGWLYMDKLSCATVPSTPAATIQQVQNSACPNQKPGELCYTPLEPFPGVDQSGSAQSLESVLNFIFKTLFTIGGLIAVLFLILGGLAYMTSEVAHKKDEAKKRIAGAVYGLVLLAVSWIILNEINPELLQFDFQPQQSQSSATPPPFVQYNAVPGTTTYTCYQYDEIGRGRPIKSVTIKNSAANTQTGAVITKFAADCERSGYIKITSS